MIDVSEAIDEEAIACTLRRKGAPSFTQGGDVVPGGATDAPIFAALLALSLERYGDMLRDKLEGIDRDGLRMLYSRSEVRLDDAIIRGADTYRVLALWPRVEGGYYRAAIGRIKA